MTDYGEPWKLTERQDGWRLKSRYGHLADLSKDDWEMAHAALLARYRRHGACNLHPAECTQVEFGWTADAFGLGYFDGSGGELTHFFWCSPKGEHGPYNIYMMAYQNWDQFLELMALLKNMGDQVRQVRMREPGDIQLQDLLVQPFRYRQLTESMGDLTVAIPCSPD